MTSVVVTLIGILSHRMVQSQARVARMDAQRDEAMALAESAVQWGVHYVTLKDGWRSAITSGQVIRTMPLGSGQVSVSIADADSDLDDNELEGFTVTGIGSLNGAVQTLSVDLEYQTGGPHPALLIPVSVGGSLYLDPNVLWTESRGVAGQVYRRDGSGYLLGIGSPADTANSVELPDPALIDLWANKGTLVTGALHNGTISGAMFTAAAAPYGLTPDPDGIYVIDANSSSLLITGCTFDGTLIVRNLRGNDVRIVNSLFTFGAHGGPTLIVEGNADLELGGTAGMSEGIFYINGNARIDAFLMLQGLLMVTGNLRVDTPSVVITNSATAVAGPPAGFTEIEGLAVVPGSWRRVVD